MEPTNEPTVYALPSPDIACIECARRAIRRNANFNYYLGYAVGVAVGYVIARYILKGN